MWTSSAKRRAANWSATICRRLLRGAWDSRADAVRAVHRGGFRTRLDLGFTYPAEYFLSFELGTRTTEILAYTGNSIFFSQPHNAVVDSDGWVWGTYAETRAWDEPRAGDRSAFSNSIPTAGASSGSITGFRCSKTKSSLCRIPPNRAAPSLLHETRHQVDYGFCDSMAYDGERYIYAGTVAGVLCRIDTGTDRVEKVAHVMASGRFPALAFGTGRHTIRSRRHERPDADSALESRGGKNREFLESARS